MKSLRERLDWAMDLKGLNKNGWSELAGMHRDTLRQAYKRADDNGVDISLTVDTLAKLAESAGLSMDWLIAGRGSAVIVPTEYPDDPRYPSRSVASVTAEAAGILPAAIRIVNAMDYAESDPGVDHWLQLMLVEHRRLKAS